MAKSSVAKFWGVALSLALLTAGAAVGQTQSTTDPEAQRILDALRERKFTTRGISRPAPPSTGGPSASSPQTALAPADPRQAERARLIADLKVKAVRGLSVQERSQLAEVVAERPAVDLEVFFDLDSADITPKAEPQLRSLGTALADPQLKGKTVLLAGHTDASGPRTYNQQLSERRANAVKAYLVQNFGLSQDALMSVGYGPERLKNPQAPKSGVNRRVEIVNLGQ
jgi:outer membrane protein OmpA-like peptidoglycan-associated protein